MRLKRLISSKNLITAFIAVAILSITLFIFFDRKRIIETIYTINIYYIPYALILSFFSYFFFGLSFARTGKILGINLSERNLIKIGMISSVLSNIISMGGIAGYSSKILLLRRMKVDTNKIAALSILHTNVVNISLALLLPLGLLYIILFNGESEFSKATTWLQTILITGFVIFLNFAIFTKSFKNFAIRIIKKFSAKGINTTLLIEGVESFNTSARSLLENGRKNPYQLIEIIVYSLLDWLASICVLGTCLYMLNSEVGLGVLISTFTIALITSYISFVPGGIGIQEASMTGILALFGVDIYIAILATILFRLFYYVLPLLLAIYIYRFRIKEPEEITIV